MSTSGDGRRPFLLISYFYPPFQSVGAVRVSKMSKHLAAQGWRPTVLTTANDTSPATMPLEVPEEWVHRTQMLDINVLPRLAMGRKRVAQEGYWNLGQTPKDRLLAQAGRLYRGVVNFPDGQIGWFPSAVRRGAALIQAERPALIYSSAMPATSHLIAAALSRRFDIPWIAEFRDPWTDSPNYDRPAGLALVERWLEKRTLSRASRIVSVTPDMLRGLVAKHGLPGELVPNGFDPEDLPAGVPLTPGFTITFTGMAYPSKQSLRPLFEAVAELQRAREVPAGFQVRLVGRHVAAFAAEAAVAGVSELVEVSPQVTRDAALRLQVESTVLLLPLWTNEAAGAWYPAKMFEYMGARRPILAVGPESNEAARLLTTRGAGWVAATSAAAKAVLRGWFEDYRRGGAAGVKPGALLDEFRRERAARHLARVFDTVAGEPPRRQ